MQPDWREVSESIIKSGIDVVVFSFDGGKKNMKKWDRALNNKLIRWSIILLIY